MLTSISGKADIEPEKAIVVKGVGDDLTGAGWAVFQKSIMVENIKDSESRKQLLHLVFTRGNENGIGGHYGIAILNPEGKIKLGGKNKITFLVKGNSQNGTAELNLTLSAYDNSGKPVMNTCKRNIGLNKNEWQDIALSLANDFGLTGEKYDCFQMKLIVNAQKTIAGSKIDFVISDLIAGEYQKKTTLATKTKESTKTITDLVNLNWISENNLINITKKMDSQRRKEVLCLKISHGNIGAVYSEAPPSFKTTAQHKASFWVKGSSASASVGLIFELAIKKGEKLEVKSSGIRTINTDKWQKIILNLDSDLGLNDAEHTIAQFKFIINSKNMNAVENSEIYISDLLIAEAGQIGVSSAKETFIVGKKENKSIKLFDFKPITVCQAINNSDYRKKYLSGIKTKIEEAYNAGPGYTELLATPFNDFIFSTPAFDGKNDVYVISSVMQYKNLPIEKVIADISQGKGLLIFGNNNAELSPLLPVKIRERVEFRPSERSALVIKATEHPLFKNIQLNKLKIGRYLDLELLPGSKVLASWEDGTPAIVESSKGQGRILYFGFGIGQALTDNDIFYDEMYVRAILYLSKNQELIEKIAALSTFKKTYEDFDKIGSVIDVIAPTSIDIKNSAQNTKNELIEFSHKLKDLSAQTIDNELLKHKTKLVSIKQQLKTISGYNYSIGASRDNFGRFGWSENDGYLVHEVNQNLEVSSLGLNGYRVSTGETLEKLNLPSLWKFKLDLAREGEKNQYARVKFNDSGWAEKKVGDLWPEIGVGWYRAETFIPLEWKGKKLTFTVNGIDDTDIVYMNGVRIGSTDTDTPEYWKVQRVYSIPSSIIVWGGKNLVSIAVNNLRGTGGLKDTPSIIVEKENLSAPMLSVEDVSWVKKEMLVRRGGEKDNGFKMCQSLLSPGILYAINDMKMNIETTSVNYISYQSGQKIVTINLRNNESYDGVKNPMSENWLLLYKAGAEKEKPLLVVLQKKPKTIKTIKTGDFLQGVYIEGNTSIGTVVISYPFGIEPKSGEVTTAWLKSFPEDVLSRCRFMSRTSLCFPIQAEEVYAFDFSENKMISKEKFYYYTYNDEWGTIPRKVVWAPPQVAFAAEKGLLVTPVEKWSDFNIPTMYGMLRGLENADTISWKTEIPIHNDVYYPRTEGYDKYSKIINDHFIEGVKWSCGGKTPQSAWLHEKNTCDRENKFFDMHAMFMGLLDTPFGRDYLNPEARVKLQERESYRIQKTLELYQHRAITHYREEPFSSLRYLITFNSFYENKTLYAPGLGSSIIYGDANESSTMIPLVAYNYAKRYGEWDFLKLNRNYLKESIRLMYVSDDWGYMGTGCREFGGGVWIDMLNCEYSGLAGYAKLAKSIGDEEGYYEALYRALRRAIPTLTRFWFKPYVDQYYGLTAEAELILGYKEGGVVYNPKMLTPFLFGNMIDFFNHSQGIDRELIILYKQYAGDKITAYIKNNLIPSATHLNRPFGFEAIRVIALFGGASAAEIDNWVKISAALPIGTDWPGLRQTATLADVIFSQNSEIFLIDWQPAELIDTSYSGTQLTLKLLNKQEQEFYKVLLYSERIPVNVTVNGKKINGEITAGKQEAWSFNNTNGQLTIVLSGANGNTIVQVNMQNKKIEYKHPYSIFSFPGK